MTNAQDRCLHIVTDEEANLLEKRARARARFTARYDTDEARRTMLGALDRVALTYSGGEFRGIDFPWEALCDEDMAEEVWQPTAARYSGATASRDASAVRKMLEACWREGLLTHDQYQRATHFRVRRRDWSPPPGRTLTDPEITQLVAYDPPDTSFALRVRDRALVLMLASTGARRSELSHVSLDNLHLTESRVRLIVTKNGQPRDAWLHPSTIAGVEHWLSVRGGALDGPLLVPLSRTGRPLLDRRLSPHQMWKILRRRSIDCGIGPVTPHDMRRFVVTRLLEEGHDLLLVSRLVGHSDPSITKLYDRRPAEVCRQAIATLPLPALNLRPVDRLVK